MSRTFVGFGFGAIQAGLYLYEGARSGAFSRLVVAYRRPEVIARVRAAGGYALNIAHPDGFEQVQVGPVEMEDVGVAEDRVRLIKAVAEASELVTALSSVHDYTSAGPESVHRLLAAGLREKARRAGPRAVVYASENHNHAAERLERAVFTGVPAREREAVRSCVYFSDTVIGKMSGVVTGAREVEARGLTPVTPGSERAFLVEAFNRILVSKIPFEGFGRSFPTFEEKANLLPFEEAKLYGHNATHALAAYVGAFLGVKYIADLRNVPGMMSFLRAAFLEESGAGLIKKYAGLDPLFSPQGYHRYADDLLTRMTNPHLRDTVARVGRDPARKLGWDDRLVGTVRLGLRQGVTPRRYALGAAAALWALEPSSRSLEARLEALWGDAPDASEKEVVLRLIREGQQRLDRWREGGFGRLEALFS